MKVSIVVPTVDGREDYLDRCLRGYEERTEAEVELLVVRNRWSGGMAWQEGAEAATGDYLHLTNDDIIPGEGWLDDCVEAVRRGMVPVVAVMNATPEIHDDEMMPLPGNPMNDLVTHFEGVPKLQLPWHVATRGNESEYPSLPFCSLDQWRSIGPMIPTQYGTDKWFGQRAWDAGFANVCVTGSIFYHFAAGVGRDEMIDGWLGFDRLTFDQNIAYPMYRAGTLPLDQLHPEAKTLRGREMAREWYRKFVPPPYPWKDSEE